MFLREFCASVVAMSVGAVNVAFSTVVLSVPAATAVVAVVVAVVVFVMRTCPSAHL